MLKTFQIASFCIAFIALTVTAIVSGCSTKKTDTFAEPTIAVSKELAYFGIDAAAKSASPAEITTLKAISDLVGRFSEALSFSEATKLTSSKFAFGVFLIPFKGEGEKMVAIKFNGVKLSGTSELEELLWARQATDPKNGIMGILRESGEAIRIDFVDGKFSCIDISRKEFTNAFRFASDCQGGHGGTGFCQREPNESYATCYNKEKDQFCDSFISCIALDVAPSIPIVIGFSCTCAATPCPTN